MFVFQCRIKGYQPLELRILSLWVQGSTQTSADTDTLKIFGKIKLRKKIPSLMQYSNVIIVCAVNRDTIEGYEFEVV